MRDFDHIDEVNALAANQGAQQAQEQQRHNFLDQVKDYAQNFMI